MRYISLLLLAGAMPLVWADPGEADRPGGSPQSPSEALLFETAPAVETAALYTQTLQEAPANVTVITRQEIRRYGYRTLAEALSNVRGFYFTFDGDLYYAGVRGFGLPGDINTRILVMLNGHFLTDNVYGAMYMFGQDFGVDMDLVERIEIVRGPSSSLYGSNGVFATVNIFTRAAADSPRGYVSTETGSFGDKKALVSSSLYLGSGVNLMLSASAFHVAGRTIEATDLGGLQTDSVGAEQGYHTFAQLTWRNWSFTANFQDRKAIIPTGWYRTDFGNTGTSSRDAHNFVEAALIKPVGLGGEIQWRVYYDQYRYFGRYDTTEDGVATDLRDWAVGDWMGTRFSYRRDWGRYGNLTLGMQANLEFRNLQVGEYVQPAYERYFEIDQPDRSYGVFAQHVYEAGPQWTFFTGLRLDDSKNHRHFLSPKLAAVWNATGNTAYKFMYGRAFRNPSTFEKFYEPNPMLEAEKVDTFEIGREQRLFQSIDLTASIFHYRLGGLIEGVPTPEYDIQYHNVEKGYATGAEFQVDGHWDRFALSGSLSVQKAKYTGPDRDLPNSPTRIGQLRASVPLLRNRLILTGAGRYLSQRESPYGFQMPAVALADFTATTNGLHRNFDLQFGIRNLTDRNYSDPLGAEHLTQVMPRAGRSIYLKLIWHYGD